MGPAVSPRRRGRARGRLVAAAADPAPNAARGNRTDPTPPPAAWAAGVGDWASVANPAVDGRRVAASAGDESSAQRGARPGAALRVAGRWRPAPPRHQSP